MPYAPNLDAGENARILVGAVGQGVDMGATRRSLDLRQAEEDRTQQDWQRENAQRGASDEVWRTLATEYLMKGLDHEDLIADYMPNSPDGQRFLAMGKGAARAMGGGMGPSVDAGMMPPSAPINSATQVPGAAAGGMGPPMDAGELPDPMTQAAGGMGGGGGGMAIAAGAPGMPEHPDDERLRRALMSADSKTIQQVLPHLKDEKKRRALTRTMNHLIDEGIHDAVVTPHLASIINYYWKAGEPDHAIETLARAYEDHGKHTDAMELERLRQSGRLEGIDARGENTLDAIGARNTGAMDRTLVKEDGTNTRFDRKQSETERSNQVKEDQGQQKIDESKYVHDKTIEQRGTRLKQYQQQIDNPKKSAGSPASNPVVYQMNQDLKDIDRHHANLHNQRQGLAKERDSLAYNTDKASKARVAELRTSIDALDEDLTELNKQRREFERARDKAIQEHGKETGAKAEPSDDDLATFAAKFPDLSPEQLEAKWNEENGGGQ